MPLNKIKKLSNDNSYRKLEKGSLSKKVWPSHVNQAVKYIGLSKWEWHINKPFPVTVQIVIKRNILERMKSLYNFSQVYL